jgi:FKBP-type peptidyl-prolyl cis-trans isomerase
MSRPLQFFQFSLLLLAGCLIVLSGCKTSTEKNSTPPQSNQKEDLIRHQQGIVRDQDEEIENYIRRRQYTMTRTQTGLRYMIYHTGDQLKKITDEDVVVLRYKVSLLDGKQIYSSDTDGAMELKVGKSEVAGGLQEGLKYMHVGDKAIMIIPSHLAYGLTGDGDRIKQYDVLIVDVEVVEKK